ncbi:MAG: helix-turn-helix domain-containing protein [Nonlabens sp.]|uniref:helix-turn-helix domain-containing protein n=1 Tax=Nonlabens sp. TaxID=1888209 RepID=UPI00321B36C4
MNQPELGNYIAALRKEQGLTQEELVEKCNINVRTIQRIENGDVTPRSYTVKNILEALGKSFDEVFQGTTSTDSTQVRKDTESVSHTYNSNKLLLSGVGGILLFISYQMMTINDVIHSFTFNNILPYSVYSIFGFTSIISALLLCQGIYHIGKVRENSLLKIAAVLAAILYNSSTAFLLFFIDYETNFYRSTDIILGIAVVVMTGIAYIMLGAGYLAQRKEETGTDKYMGFIALIAGAMTITIILAPIAILFMIVFDIFQIIYIIKYADKSKKSQLGN